ncbi:hypothetical protein L1049_020097 [Liquidambar formosana]|uniref:FRIGIDA-like protein n=1 Tax=Liquidambar formosana TaxID=63359 RepID=A0AAP0S9B6_LIQFO
MSEKISAELKLAKSKKQSLSKTFEDLETHFNAIASSLRHRYEELESKEQALNSIQTLIEQRLIELDAKEADFEGRLKKLEFDEKKFDEAVRSKVQVEAQDDFDDCVDIRFCVSMDGKRLQLFLNEKKDHEKTGDEVYEAIQMSKDPAKLVLDAMEGFYPPRLKKGDVEFEAGVVRRTCVLLLEQLLRLSPRIRQSVREEAARVAGEWKGKMTVENGDWLEVLGFLLLVGSYGLASDFDGDEILKLFGIVAKHRQAPELCHALGIADKGFWTGTYSSVSHWPELKSFCISMDGNGLRLFLSEHVKEHDAMQSEVFDALQCASDPVKLVLDAMHGFNSWNSDAVKRSKLGASRTSCILLLEQLMRVSPQIEPQMKEAALKIAVDWKSKFLEHNKNPIPVMVLGFLQLLATFELHYSFGVDELFCLLKSGHRLKQAPYLFHIFGLAYKIPQFIRLLIKKKQRIEAIRYIYAFNLAELFPPVDLLKAHVDYSKMHTKKICQEGKYSRLAKNVATKNEVNALTAVVRCIEDYKLESEYPPEILKKRIVQLEKQIKNREGNVPAPASKGQPQKQSGIKRPTCSYLNRSHPKCFSWYCFHCSLDTTTSAASTLVCISRCTKLEHISQHLSSSAGPHAVAGTTLLTPHTSSSAGQYGSGFAANSNSGQFGLAATYFGGRHPGISMPNHYNNSSSANVELSVTMDGKILQMFLNERWKEHDSMHGEVSTALRLSSDPAKLVLDAMQGFYPVHLENGSMDVEVSVIRKSCILLLEQLMKVSPEIKPHVKEGAMKLAFDWMTKMRPAAENYLEVLGFLLLVASYGLASAFDEDELVSLLLIVAQHSQAPELCRVLGLADMIPLSSILHKPVKIKQSLSETIELNNIGASSSVGPWPELKSFCISMDGNGLRLFLNKHVKEHNAMLSEVFDALQCASDPVKIVLDAMQGFNSCNSDAVMRKKLGVNRMSCIVLLEQLMRLSPQITPQMKEEAMKIAVDWKSKFREHNENPVKVLGFLQLVATFELASSFKSDELFCLLKTVYHLEQAPHLCQIFGLAYEIPHFIHKLVKKGQRLMAVRYIYAFNLVDKFPPVPLLKDHVDYSKMHAEKICQKGNYSLPAQDAAIKNEINALMAVLKCIEDHKLKFEYPPEILKKRIVQLQKQKENKEGTAPASASNAQPQKQSGNKRPRTAVSTEATPNAASTIHLIQPPQQPACFLAYQGAPNSSTSATDYGFGCSTPADGHLSSSAGPYAMAGSTRLTPRMSSSAGQCRSGIAANGSTGQFGLAGTYIGGTHPGTSSPNSFIHYYPRDALSGLHDSDIPASFNGYSSPRYHLSPHP